MTGISFGLGSFVTFSYFSNTMAGDHITNAKILIRTQQEVSNQELEKADKTLSIMINGSIRALETIDATVSLSNSYKKDLEELQNRSAINRSSS